jgi:KipI family sensor histidine kinase inhibitor
VEVDDAQQALAVYDEARRREVSAADIVSAARTVLFEQVDDVDALVASLPSWQTSGTSSAGDLVEVPTTYDGQDLDDVARRWDMTRDEVVGTHTGTELVVAFCGFAPGFPYCTGLPGRLAVPRLDSPRTRVPAGAVGLAGPFTGIYPTASPGGWRLIGRTDLVLWDADRDPPATLAPGTRVRFVAT